MSSGKTKEFFVSGASTPLTAVAAEPLSITESVAPQPPPPKASAAKAFKKKPFGQSGGEKKSFDDTKKDSVVTATESVSKDPGEVVNVPTATETVDAQESLTKAHKPGSPTHSSKGSVSSSLESSAKVQQQHKTKPGLPLGGKILNAEQDLRSRQQSTSHTPSPQGKRKEEVPSGKKYNREALLEEYNALQKERKSLRKRNLQAQTNIAQYMRKHR